MKTSKVATIISWILIVLPSLMLLMSAFMKFSGAEPIKSSFELIGLGDLRLFIGTLELVSVVLLLVPKTYRIGFFLVNGYLGGAMSIELSGGQFPVAAALLAVVWIGVFLRDPSFFLGAKQAPVKA